jgi:hypothetical protein
MGPVGTCRGSLTMSVHLMPEVAAHGQNDAKDPKRTLASRKELGVETTCDPFRNARLNR